MQFFVQNRTLIKLASWVSNFFNPLTSLLLFFIYYSIHNFSLSESIKYFLPIILIMILPIIIWIFYNVKTDRYTNMDVSNRNQRKSLYVFISATFVIYLGYFYWRNGQIDWMMFFLFVLILVMQVSNFFIKSSMHTAFNVYTAFLFFSENVGMGIAWLIISFLVGYSRIILKRHTLNEVIMGFMLAIAVGCVFLQFAHQIL